MYGLTLNGLTPGQYAVGAAESWQDWTVAWASFDGVVPPTYVGPQSATLPLLPQGFAEISRRDFTTTFHSLYLPDADALAHPLLAGTAVMAAHWRGDISFHAGGIVVGDGVWGVLGTRESGKSTTLAWSLLQGLDIWTDDLIVLRGRTALAGPRCLDLRETAHTHYGLGSDIGVVGTRRRWRVGLDDLPGSELPLLGWIALEWADEVAVATVPPRERLQILAEHRALQVPVEDPSRWLLATGLPMYRLSRPRSWEPAEGALANLVATLRTYESAASRGRGLPPEREL